MLTRRLAEYSELVKLEHTVFALPFALSAVLLASYPAWPSPVTVGWVIAAMVGGRTYAMGLNRLLDARYDAQNPRTASRAIPAGRISHPGAWTLTLLALVLLMIATLQLPVLCQQLLPVAVALLTVYSLMKRFSAAAHVVLGLCLGSSAIAGWLAVTGEWHWWPFGLGCVVLLWVTGFDLIYACQDVDVDRQLGLHSIPAWLGIAPALKLSQWCHSLTMVGLGLLWLTYPHAHWPLWLSWLTMAGFLLWEHQLVKAHDLSRVNMAFFTLNGWVSVAVFISVVLNHWVGLGVGVTN
jgi:4-hydroxybenzoate polyprenyltransferase